MNFAIREAGLQEEMDDPACDLELLNRTYAHFALMNRLVSGWRRIYRQRFRPLFRDLNGPITLLDIGCGGGDVPARLARWSESDGIDLRILATDADERAVTFARNRRAHDRIEYRCCTLDTLEREHALFDFVLSNHVLHHLTDEETGVFLHTSARLARRMVLHNDIYRSPVAYYLFKYSMPLLFRNAFTVADGLRSIRKSYRTDELAALVPEGWSVYTGVPWRVIVVKQNGTEHDC